jgi:hypothetical protein
MRSQVDKVKNQLTVEVTPSSFVDEGDGVVSFPNGLTITDGSVQRNGTVYDIDTLDISRYGNQLTGDHKDELGNLIGETIGVVKQNGKVVVNKIRYAIKENPYARLAYNLLVGGFSKNFSTETIGPAPDANTGIYWNAELVGLSQVVTQNNYNAHVNKFTEVVHNSLEQSKNDGLDVSGIEERVIKDSSDEKENKMEDKDKKVESEEVKTTESEETKQAPVVAEDPKGEDTQETPHLDTSENDKTEEEVDKSEESDKETKEEETETKTNESEEAKNEVEDETKTEEVVSEDEKETNKKETKMDEKDKKVENASTVTISKEDLAELFKNALAPVTAELASVREEAKNAFDASAKEPEFKAEEKAENSLADMDWQDRYQEQINAAWNFVKSGSHVAGEKLREINELNLQGLKDAKIARNSITLDDLGNFVIPTEMYNEIQGHRNDYTAILNATEWKETLSLEFAWLKRVGDIDMQPVAIGSAISDDVNGYTTPVDDDARLKPISEYSAVPQKSGLEELAAVTVVANSTTRFAAVDLLADAARGYRTDYDRKRAQLVIARLEQAIDETGNSVGYAPTNDVVGLTIWLDAITEISDTTLNGTLIFNARTYAELKKRALQAGANGPWAEILTGGEIPTVFGYRYIIVPNDLMPSLDGSEDIRFRVNNELQRIQHAVFFADLTTFTGRTSGGLSYDVSNTAPYEVGAGNTRSAFQRNELVLRGSFFRGGAVMDVNVVAGVRQGASANVS